MNSIIPIITAFRNSPDRGAGLARDFRIRWALEEVGQPYRVRLLTFDEMKEPSYLALQPFAQIPTYEDGDVALFESGAILVHIAQQHQGLLPTDKVKQARALSWIFAAVSTVEPTVVERETIKYFEHGRSWQEERFAMADARIRHRFTQLAAALGQAPWLAGEFSAADIMMVHVLRRLEGSALLDEQPLLSAYISRATERPAYQRAFAAQRAVFESMNQAL